MFARLRAHPQNVSVPVNVSLMAVRGDKAQDESERIEVEVDRIWKGLMIL